MERPIRTELLERVAASESIARKLGAIRKAAWPVRFSHVIEPAQPFFAAAIAHVTRAPANDRARASPTIWVLCPSVHSQESFYESLLNWQSSALFLPEAELVEVENVLPDPEMAAERLALLMQIERDSEPHIIVATSASIDQAAPKHGTLQSAVIELRRGAMAKMEGVIDRLVGSGYERVAQVTARGQFAVRGGIVDLYSWQASLPFRVEFFDDQIESLREFDIDAQTSTRDLRSVDLLVGTADDQSGFVRDYIRDNDLIIVIEPDEQSSALGSPAASPALARDSRANGKFFGEAPRTAGEGARAPQGIPRAHIQISESWSEAGPEDFSGAFQDCDVGEFAAGDLVLAEAKRAHFVERLNQWRANKARIVIYFQTEGEIERFREIMAGAVDGIDFVEGTLPRGFCFPSANLVVLSAAELFGRFAVHPRRLSRLRRAERHRAQIDFSELNEDDLVVHLEHGVGKFLGLQKIPVGQAPRPPDTAELSPAIGRLPYNSKISRRRCWCLSLQTKRSSMFRLSRRIWFRAMLAQEKNLHR